MLGLALASAHGFAVGQDIFIVLFDGAGEAVVAFGVGHKVEVVALRGMQGGFEGAASGIADGARRQSGMAVGVVGRAELHVGVMQFAGISSGQKFRVNDAGVGVEGDVLVQSVVVNAGDERALFSHGGFF